jgi:hypothetical protein
VPLRRTTVLTGRFRISDRNSRREWNFVAEGRNEGDLTKAERSGHHPIGAATEDRAPKHAVVASRSVGVLPLAVAPSIRLEGQVFR